MTYRKSHTRFLLVPKSTTLDDLEGSLRTLFQNTCVFGAHHENLNEDIPLLSATKMYPMTLLSGNIRFMRGCSQWFIEIYTNGNEDLSRLVSAVHRVGSRRQQVICRSRIELIVLCKTPKLSSSRGTSVATSILPAAIAGHDAFSDVGTICRRRVKDKIQEMRVLVRNTTVFIHDSRTVTVSVK